MINKKIIHDQDKKAIKKDFNKINSDAIDILKNELKISADKIQEIFLKQNEKILQVQQRLQHEVEKYKKFSLEKLIIEFLPIIDNIERAYDLIQQKKEKKYIDILKNIEYVLSLIKVTLNAFKISKIHDTEAPFDPNIHQAISVRYSNKIQPNKILEVMQSGYIMHNTRLLRPSMVVVSKNEINNS